MHSSHVRSIAALLVVLGLSACGGKESFSVSGTVSRLDFNGLILANGSDTVSLAAVTTPVVTPPATIPTIPFVFQNRIDYGTEYNVTVQRQPDNMKCTVAPNGNGSAGRTERINATVTCTVDSYVVGGTITGLTKSGLMLTNGADNVSPNAGDVEFAFKTKVNVGQTYGVRVSSSPAGQTCTVPNDTVVMGPANVTVMVTCDNTPPTTN
jgi:hypothetical protein